MKQKPKLILSSSALKLKEKIRSAVKNGINCTTDEIKTYINILKEFKNFYNYSDTLFISAVFLLYKDKIIQDEKKITFDHINYLHNKISILEARELLSEELHLSKYFDLYYNTKNKMGKSFPIKEKLHKTPTANPYIQNVSYQAMNITSSDFENIVGSQPNYVDEDSYEEESSNNE